jgi:hypothetical protein
MANRNGDVAPRSIPSSIAEIGHSSMLIVWQKAGSEV